MSLLGAVTVDFAEQLKKRTKGWIITPLVVDESKISRHGLFHSSFIFVKRIPYNQSPTTFYINNSPLGDWAFLQIKQKYRPLRIISLRLDKTLVRLGFWRANGYVQNGNVKQSIRSRRYNKYDPVPENCDALLMCKIYHVGPKVSKYHRKYYNHSFDLTVPEVPSDVLDAVHRVVDKSYEWWGRGGKECFGDHQFPLMVCLEGKNYNADENHAQ